MIPNWLVNELLLSVFRFYFAMQDKPFCLFKLLWSRLIFNCSPFKGKFQYYHVDIMASSSNNDEDKTSLLVVVIDVSDAFTHSASAENATQRVG